MGGQDRVAVIGAGVIGSAIAYALAREGRQVVLFERGEPATSGASYGNVGHIAAELVEPLPSLPLLFGFWRELFAFGGPLDIPLARLPKFLPWAMHFAAAALRRKEHTQHLAPLVRAGPQTLARWLGEIGHGQLFKRQGHYEIWLGASASQRAIAQARAMNQVEVQTAPAPRELLETVRQTAQATDVAGLWFPTSGHVIDPLLLMQAFAAAAAQRGTEQRRALVHELRVCGQEIEVRTESDAMRVDAAVICAGVWSAALLSRFGLKAPLQSVRGYHVELPNQPALVDAPILYANEHLLVTPMSGRLRASSFMEFAAAHAESDVRKPRRLRNALHSLGYTCDADGPSWVGPRPVLPDYLPGIGRAPGPGRLFYAIGHQHIGLTIAAVTGELVADLVAERTPRLAIDALDLRRFS